jgi:hypothetical protein
VAHLIKACDVLRLTYQIRLLTFMASQQGLRLVIHIKPATRVSHPLETFVREHLAIVSIERSRS